MGVHSKLEDWKSGTKQPFRRKRILDFVKCFLGSTRKASNLAATAEMGSFSTQTAVENEYQNLFLERLGYDIYSKFVLKILTLIFYYEAIFTKNSAQEVSRPPL